MSDTFAPFDPKQYGVDITNPVDALIKAREGYVSTVNHLKAVKDDGKVKEIFAQWRENTPAVSIAEPECKDNELLAYADLFAELSKKYKRFADVAARESLGMNFDGPIREDKINSAAQLRKLTESLFAMLYPLGLVPDEFPVKTGKNGETLPDLPKNAHKTHDSK